LKIGINSHDLQTSFWKLARLPCHGEESLLSRGSGHDIPGERELGVLGLQKPGGEMTDP
jgi:hypothetical protein